MLTFLGCAGKSAQHIIEMHVLVNRKRSCTAAKRLKSQPIEMSSGTDVNICQCHVMLGRDHNPREMAGRQAYFSAISISISIEIVCSILHGSSNITP